MLIFLSDWLAFMCHALISNCCSAPVAAAAVSSSLSLSPSFAAFPSLQMRMRAIRGVVARVSAQLCCPTLRGVRCFSFHDALLSNFASLSRLYVCWSLDALAFSSVAAATPSRAATF